MNAVWEAAIVEGWVKPEPNASRSERETWIRAKYDAHSFVGDYAAKDGSSIGTLGALVNKVIAAALKPLSVGGVDVSGDGLLFV